MVFSLFRKRKDKKAPPVPQKDRTLKPVSKPQPPLPRQKLQPPTSASENAISTSSSGRASSKIGSEASLRTQSTSEKFGRGNSAGVSVSEDSQMRTLRPEARALDPKGEERKERREGPKEKAEKTVFQEGAPPMDSGLINGKTEKSLRPPRINTDQPVLSSPSSPLSVKSASSVTRHPPASYIRHSRVMSGSSTFAGGLNEMFSPSKTLRHRQREIITDLPHQMSPVVNLSNAQRLRQYAAGPLCVLAADGVSWLPGDAVLTGTELSIWVVGGTKQRYLNIQDCKILPSSYHVPGDEALFDLMILQDYDFNSTSLRFQDANEMHTWLAALHLSKFEYTSLSEAFTAVVLSLKGPQLSDVYTLLAHKKRFARFEWCNLRLPQISNKWIKVFMAIIPGDAKKNGRVEMYTSEKLNKKNLVLYVNKVHSAYNVYPEDYHMIDFNSIMKLEGEVFVNKSFEHLFGGEGGSGVSSPRRVSRPNSVTSLSSFTAPAPIALASRSRSTSISSASSFFVNAPSPTPEPQSKKDTRSHFFKKQAVNNFVTTSYFYLMPDTHPGVSAIEIMLRNFVHIIDAFKLYGRPDHFSSNKKDPQSLLFGLPSLPHYCYLDNEDAFGVVAANFDTARLSDWGEWEWRSCIKEFLSCLQGDGEYRGTGDINELFRSVETASVASSDNYGDMSPYSGISRVGSPKADNFGFSRVGSPEFPRSGSATHELSKLRVQPGDEEVPPPETAELGTPIEFGSRPGLARDPARDPALAAARAATRERPLHPIVDYPTPIDDAQASYFAQEQQVPLRS